MTPYSWRTLYLGCSTVCSRHSTGRATRGFTTLRLTPEVAWPTVGPPKEPQVTMNETPTRRVFLQSVAGITATAVAPTIFAQTARDELSIVKEALIELEAAIGPRGVTAYWRNAFRRRFAATVRAAADAHAVAHQAVEVSRGLTDAALGPAYQAPANMGVRGSQWRAEMDAAQTVPIAARLLIELETFVRPGVMTRGWAGRRTAWIERLGRIAAPAATHTGPASPWPRSSLAPPER